MTGRFSAQQQSAPATAGNPYRTRAEEDVNSCYILELRRKLYNLLHFLRTIGDLRSTKREFKDIHFYELYETISELLSQGHYAGFEERYEGLIIASINPEDPENSSKYNWHVLIEYSIAEYLDVKGQFVTPTDQFLNSKTLTTCFEVKHFTIRSASFTESRLLLSKPQESCKDTNNIIYGIRCKLCHLAFLPTSNIRYVGKVGNGETASVHKRHTKYQNEANKNMHEHVDKVHHSILDFHDMMEMIYLPIGDWGIVNQIHLYSWECFWQFFCRVRECRGGWCTKSPNKDVKIVNQDG